MSHMLCKFIFLASALAAATRVDDDEDPAQGDQPAQEIKEEWGPLIKKATGELVTVQKHKDEVTDAVEKKQLGEAVEAAEHLHDAVQDDSAAKHATQTAKDAEDAAKAMGAISDRTAASAKEALENAVSAGAANKKLGRHAAQLEAEYQKAQADHEDKAAEHLEAKEVHIEAQNAVKNQGIRAKKIARDLAEAKSVTKDAEQMIFESQDKKSLITAKLGKFQPLLGEARIDLERAKTALAEATSKETETKAAMTAAETDRDKQKKESTRLSNVVRDTELAVVEAKEEDIQAKDANKKAAAHVKVAFAALEKAEKSAASAQVMLDNAMEWSNSAKEEAGHDAEGVNEELEMMS